MSEQEKPFDKDTYRTPMYFVTWLRRRQGWWHNWIDGCASKKNAVFDNYIGKGIDAIFPDFLDFDPLSIVTDFADADIAYFVNPPYSNPMPFVKRAAELKQQGYLVVMLLPADKSTKWYKVIQDNATEVIDIIGGRINFLDPDGNEVKGNNKGSMVAVFDPFMQGFVTRQVELDFVKQWGTV